MIFFNKHCPCRRLVEKQASSLLFLARRGRPLQSGLTSGYILLLTLLIISILLAMSFGIYTISIKEIVLASFLRDSQQAFAAASSGAECALYWDRVPSLLNPQLGITYTIFATGTIPTLYQIPSNLSNAVCNNGQSNIQLSLISVTGWTVTTTVTTGTTAFLLNFSNGSCVDVVVTKTGNESTLVVSDGYNTCDTTFPRRTQREIVVFTNI